MSESQKRPQAGETPDVEQEEVDRTSPAFIGLDKPFTRAVEEKVSSKKLEEPGKQPEGPPRQTRARRPRSGRSGSDSSASRRTRGH